MELYERLIDLRKEANLTQEKLAEILNISRQAVSKWETGASSPDINNIIQLGVIYGVSTDYILLGKQQSIGLNQVAEEPSHEDEFLENRFIWFGLSVIFVLVLYYATNGF